MHSSDRRRKSEFKSRVHFEPEEEKLGDEDEHYTDTQISTQIKDDNDPGDPVARTIS